MRAAKEVPNKELGCPPRTRAALHVGDEGRAARYFLHAASRGNAIAQNRVARLYAVGRGLPKNLVEAAAWNLAASAQGLSDPWLDENLKGLEPAERQRAETLAADRAKVN